MTDSEGQFQIDTLPPMQVPIVARKPGFFSDQEIHRGRQPQLVIVGPDSKGIVVKLAPEAIVAGTVTDSDGLPLPLLRVHVARRAIVNGRKQWLPSTQRNTDSDGAFRIGNLMPGEYVLSVGPGVDRNSLPGDGDPEGVPETYYPGVRDRTSASTFVLAPGQHTDMSMSVHSQTFYRLTGTVSGYSEPGISMSLVGDDQRNAQQVMVNAITGRFDARGVAAGQYTLQARGQTQDGVLLMGSVPVNVNSDLTGIQVALAPVPRIPILVDDRREQEQNQGGPGRLQIINGGQHRNAPVWVMAHATNGPSQGMTLSSGVPRSVSEKDGTMYLTVPPGRYTVEINCGDPTAYVYSAEYGSVDLLKDDLVVHAGSSMPIQVVLRDDGASLKGKVVSDQPFIGAKLLVIPEQASPSLIKRAFVSSSGEFSVMALRPGTYFVLAVDHDDGLEYANPKAMEGFMSKAAHVTVAAGDSTTFDVNLVTVPED